MMSIMSNKPISSPVLIGREREIATFQSLIDQVKQGHGQVLLLSGEAGIGKSRLLAEGKRQASSQGFLVLQGTCFPTDRSSPYAPLLDLFSSSHTQELLSLSPINPEPRARELARLFPDLLDHASSASSASASEPEQDKRRLFVALTRFFTGLADTQPVLLTVEDVHWSDETSLEFLHHLVRSSARHPLLLVLTYRHDEMHAELRHWLAQLDRERLAHELLLPPLSKAEIEAMLEAIFDRKQTVPAETLDALYEMTEGNPFFLEEILKSLLLTGTIVSANQMWERQPLNELLIPRSIQDAVQLRLEQVSEPARKLVMLAAVAGRRFDFALLQQITQQEEQELLMLMKEVIAAQLVVEESEERFAFRHALTREAIYRQLLLRERKVLHRTLAETMEQLYASTLDTHLTELADHFYEAGVWEQALSYSKLAGERALALYAPRAAVEQVTRALKATHYVKASPLATLYRLRGQAYETLGEFEHARADYERAFTAAHEAGEGEMEWQTAIDLGFLWAGREYERAGSFFRQAVQLAETLGDPGLYAHSLNRLGNWLANTGQVAEGLEAHQQALAVFQRQQDREGMAQTFDLLGLTLAGSGDIVKGAQQHQRAIALFRALGDQKGLISALPSASIATCPALAETVFVVVRSPEDCERDAAEVAQLARQMDWPAGEAYAELSTGVLLASFGQFGRGLAHAHKGRKLAMEIDHQQWICGAHCYLGHIYVLMLEPALALHHLDAGLQLAARLGSAWWIGHIRVCQALAYLQRGLCKQAEATLRTVMLPEQEPRTLTERRLVWAWGELALAQGEPHAALQIALRLIASAPGEMRPQPIPRLLKLQGEALVASKRLSEAVEALEEAKRGALERRETPLLWQIHRSLGQVYRRLKREEQAQGEWAAAREIIGKLVATIEDETLREHFSHTALSSLPKEKPLLASRAIASQFGGLTERERQVATLIAQGRSNREIAETLVISYRTVETHIANIMFKLSCTSRSQVAAWVVEKGLMKPPV
jgi:DNA-binding CsgD family transcriptional regulator/tetratricopeptide (TPR) repeat protein